MNEENANKNKWVSTLIILGVLFFCGTGIILLERDNVRREREESKQKQEKIDREYKEQMRQLNIDTCLKSAQDTYKERWESTCKSLNKGENCSLPSDTANKYDSDLKREKEFCLERYKN